MFDGGDADAVAQIERGAQGRAADARKMHMNGYCCGPVLKRPADQVTTIDRRRTDGQIDRQTAMNAITRKVDRSREGPLARAQFLHTRNTPTPCPVRPTPLLTKKYPMRKPHRVLIQIIRALD